MLDDSKSSTEQVNAAKDKFLKDIQVLVPDKKKLTSDGSLDSAYKLCRDDPKKLYNVALEYLR